MSKDRWGDVYSTNQVRKMVALYDYDPQKLSPNVDAEVELKFTTGDIIYVYGEMDDDGVYLAELRGQRGLVPSNFLADASSHLGGTAAAAAATATVPGGVPVGGQMVGGQMAMGQQQQQMGQQQTGGFGSKLFGGVMGSGQQQQQQQQSGATGPQPPPRGTYSTHIIRKFRLVTRYKIV